VARVIRLARAFLKARERLGVVPGTPEGKALARAVRKLGDTDTLPLTGDEEFLLPPSVWLWSHPVESTHLALVYGFDDQTVTVATLRR
jgi:hypothetical protein